MYSFFFNLMGFVQVTLLIYLGKKISLELYSTVKRLLITKMLNLQFE